MLNMELSISRILLLELLGLRITLDRKLEIMQRNRLLLENIVFKKLTKKLEIGRMRRDNRRMIRLRRNYKKVLRDINILGICLGMDLFFIFLVYLKGVVSFVLFLYSCQKSLCKKGCS